MYHSLPLLLLFACSETGLKGVEDGPSEVDGSPDPDIVVDPIVIDFGVLPAGSASEPVVVTVSNQGDGVLALGEVRLLDVNVPFSLTQPDTTLLDRGVSTTFLVTFFPSEPGVVAGEIAVESSDPDSPVVPVTVSGESVAPDIAVDPVDTDFGTLDVGATASVDVTVRNEGSAPLDITDVTYTTGSSPELSMRADATRWILAPGEFIVVTVDYAPADASPDDGYITVYSNDPDEPQAIAAQIGSGREFEGFSTGWYIVDDSTNYETTSNPSYGIESYGDIDGYWYEPSGAHGLIGSADPAGDFATLHDYVMALAGAPTPVTAPLSFRTVSTVPTFSFASYSYILCDFWIDASDDPTLYEVRASSDDDGAQVMVNGQIVANWYLGAAGSVNIGSAIKPGEVNSLIVILMDNSASDKYLLDLGFYRDGLFVSG
ncbi:MAG: choice-of-anchor D domain-containing protein [Myxococcales bacterium]|nr:choice-of-anchor D domain-containing protein [Myxococcales bacterium]